MSRVLLPFLLGLALLVAILGGLQDAPDPLEGLDPKAALELANRWAWERPEVTSYLTSRYLVFRFPDGRERRVPLPEDRVAIAVAPYLRSTHPCRVHFPSSCRGELAGVKLYVQVREEGGGVYFEGVLKTLENGFFELWLPRDRRYRLQVLYQGYRGELVLETGEDAATCRTDLRLYRF